MESQPKFIKDFSKEHSPEERSALAKEIKSKRKEYFDHKSETVNTLSESQIKQREVSVEIETIINDLNRLSGEIESLSNSIPQKIRNFFELRKLREQLIASTNQFELKKTEHQNILDAIDTLQSRLDTESIPPAFQSVRDMLKKFYDKEKKEWSRSDYSMEEMERLFTEENLSSLNEDQYGILLSKFPGHFVTHVTRQGIRDHGDLMEHTSGMSEHHDNFTRMLNDGRLRSAFGAYFTEGLKRDAVESYLFDRLKIKTIEAAIDYLEIFLDGQAFGVSNYADRSAIHFAADEVADSFYGSEKGNEIFFAFPSAFIASQYYFKGELNNSNGDTHNDQWVWANEERGIDLNAGLVFIPQDAKVDALTGSRYKLDSNNRPFFNEEVKNKITEVISSSDFIERAKILLPMLGKNVVLNSWSSKADLEFKQKADNEVNLFTSWLEDKFGIIDERVKKAIMDYHFLETLIWNSEKHINVSVNDLIDRAMSREALSFVETDNPISSEEYWNKYFDMNPEKKPNKVVFYRGGDPTLALKAWKRKHGIVKETRDPNIGFEENFVSEKSPQANEGKERFRSIAMDVIEEHFANKL